MKRFLSILAIATVVTPIIFTSTPSHALTWDDLWNAVKKSADSSSQSNPVESLSSNDNESSFNSSSQTSDISSSYTKNMGMVTRRDDLTFEYLGCRKTTSEYGNSYLSCTFKITYIGSDEMKNFAITNARVFSALDGNQYSSDSSTVGGNYSIDMISRQPVRGVINFPWSSALKRLSALEFETNNTSRKILIRYKTAQ